MPPNRSPPDPDEIFEIALPSETRTERRVPIEHTNAEWRNKLLEYHYRCAYCGINGKATSQQYLTRDHIHPVIRGGRDVIANIVPACWPCNQAKGCARPGERVWTLDYTRRVTVPQPKPRRRHIRWAL